MRLPVRSDGSPGHSAAALQAWPNRPWNSGLLLRVDREMFVLEMLGDTFGPFGIDFFLRCA
jgi:hypothetical protein